MSKDQAPTLLDVFKSVLASFFGVQSNKKRQRDFEHGKPEHFIVVGLLLTAAFVLMVLGLVKLILFFAVGG